MEPKLLSAFRVQNIESRTYGAGKQQKDGRQSTIIPSHRRKNSHGKIQDPVFHEDHHRWYELADLSQTLAGRLSVWIQITHDAQQAHDHEEEVTGLCYDGWDPTMSTNSLESVPSSRVETCENTHHAARVTMGVSEKELIEHPGNEGPAGALIWAVDMVKNPIAKLLCWKTTA